MQKQTNAEFQQKIGRNLKLARTGLGKSKSAVAKTLGINESTLTRIEAGSRPVSTLEMTKLAKLYHMPAHDLITQDYEKSAQHELMQVLSTVNFD